METYNKLVRDKIVEIINNNGKGEVAISKILSEIEFKTELLKKLQEEMQELLQAVQSGNETQIIEESADLLEVIRAINNGSLKDVLAEMENKKNKRGGFEQRIFLKRVEKVNCEEK